MFSHTTSQSISASCVLVLTHDKGKRGVMMYPVDRGTFQTDSDKEDYENLFEEKAPEVPYAGVGNRYAERNIDVEPVKAILEHMESLASSLKSRRAVLGQRRAAQENSPI